MYKTNLKAHGILTVKYRKSLLTGTIRDFVITAFNEIVNTSKFNINIMETDKNHIHMMIEYSPTISVSSIIRKLKQISTNKLWKELPAYLNRFFWKEHTFWSYGYFTCSIGNACEETIRKYIEN